MSINEILAIFALAFAVVDEVMARGRSVIAWAVILLALAILWPLI